MPEPRPLTDDEAVYVLTTAIRGGGGRSLTREADQFFATVVAEGIHERLSLAGVSLVRQEQW